MIELKNIHKSYTLGDTTIPVLHDISLSIDTWEFVAILGPSGSGKTTLMNIIGLLDTASHGSYMLDDESIDTLSEKQQSHIRGESIGFIFQNYGLIPRMSVIEQVMLPLSYQWVGPSERRERAIHVLTQVWLSGHIDKNPDTLSGGQKQRVAIARALVINPKLILADEPTGALDTQTWEDVLWLFRELHRDGSTIVIVTHSPEIAASCPRSITLRDGIILSDTCISTNI
jgi:putative ABC transport system ATP-binding protein